MATIRPLATQAPQPPTRSRLGRRITLLIVSCALLPLLTVTGLVWVKVSAQLRDQASRTLQDSAKAEGMAIVQRLAYLEVELLTLVRELQKEHGSQQAIVFRDSRLRMFHGLWLEGSDSRRTLFGVARDQPRLQEGERAHLEKGHALLRTSDHDGRPRILLGVLLPQGGVLWGEARHAFAFGGNDLHQGDTKKTVFDEHWRTLFSNLPEEQLEALREAFTKMGGHQREAELETLSGPLLARYWTVFSRPRWYRNLSIINAQSMEGVLAPVSAFRTSFILLILLTILVALFLSMSQVRRTLHPIQELIKGTRRLAQGDFASPVIVHSDDEFEHLASAFNGMAEELQSSIRARERSERQMREAQDKALQAAQAESRFLTNVSHEFLTPLTTIFASAEILEQFTDEPAETRASFIDAILSESRRMKRLLDNALHYRELSEDQVDWDLQPMAIWGILQRSCKAHLEGERGTDMDIQCHDPEVEVLNANQVIETALEALIDNAMKFSEPGSRVLIVARCIGSELRLEVRDQGVGIHQDDLEAAMSSFQQVGRCIMTEKAHGTGLGLPIASSIVRHLGGKLELQSEEGQGTVALLRLPVADAATARGTCASKTRETC